MANQRVVSGDLVPVGLQEFTLANTTAVGINTTARTGARFLRISVEAVDVRVRDDGTSPQNTTGLVLSFGLMHEWVGFNGTSDLEFVRSGGSGTAEVSIASYKYVGD